MSEPIYDVVVVGAGAVGAMVAYGLAKVGRRVLVLEAGRAYGSRTDHVEKYFAASIKTPDAPWPDDREAARPKVLEMAFKDWRWNRDHHVIQRGPLPFASTYERLAGGALNHWLGTCLRFVPADFTLASVAGIFYGRAWREQGRVPASAITHASVDAIWSFWF